MTAKTATSSAETALSQRAFHYIIHRSNIKYGKARIDGLDFTSNLRLEQGRSNGCTQHETQISAAVLVNRRIDMRNTIAIKAVLFDIFDDADYGKPGNLPILTQPKNVCRRRRDQAKTVARWPRQ